MEAGRPAPWFCLEPVSMVNDGFNLIERGQGGTGVAVLGPGEAIEARIAISVTGLE
jgi:aldose 1-epimerase